jgi:hypothetical protein
MLWISGGQGVEKLWMSAPRLGEICRALWISAPF